jgi:hypothetical protein
MRKYLASGSRFVWVSVLALVGLLILGIMILPEVLKYDYAAPGMPAGVYIMSLINLGLFVAFRVGAIAWSYQMGRHSLWYLIGSVIAHLVIGALVLAFLSGSLRLPSRKKNL